LQFVALALSGLHKIEVKTAITKSKRKGRHCRINCYFPPELTLLRLLISFARAAPSYVVVHLNLFIDFFKVNFVLVISQFFVAVFICGYWEILLLPIIIIILTNANAIVATIIFAEINY